MKQSNPANLDAAVSTTFELETYAAPKAEPLPVLRVGEDELEEDITTVAAVNPSDKLTDVIRELSERLDRLEVNQRARSRGQGVHTQQADMTSQGASFQYGRIRYSCG